MKMSALREDRAGVKWELNQGGGHAGGRSDKRLPQKSRIRPRGGLKMKSRQKK